MSKDEESGSGWPFVLLILVVLGIGIPWMIATKKEVTACEARVCRGGVARIIGWECICVTVPESAR
jgi:hypothetical protein